MRTSFNLDAERPEGENGQKVYGRGSPMEKWGLDGTYERECQLESFGRVWSEKPIGTTWFGAGRYYGNFSEFIAAFLHRYGE